MTARVLTAKELIIGESMFVSKAGVDRLQTFPPVAGLGLLIRRIRVGVYLGHQQVCQPAYANSSMACCVAFAR
jgi:hypothetical protein